MFFAGALAYIKFPLSYQAADMPCAARLRFVRTSQKSAVRCSGSIRRIFDAVHTAVYRPLFVGDMQVFRNRSRVFVDIAVC